MRGGKNTRGYTILEVMIFLAISGFMFVLSASFVSGKQAKNEFKQGMNETSTQIQQTINDVSNGLSSSNGTISCAAGGSGAVTINNGISSEQGTNQGCTLIGKIIQFGVHGTDNQGYNTYSIAGRQYKTDSSSLIPPASFAEASPVVVSELTQQQKLQWGLQVDKMYYKDTGHQIGSIGFFNGFANSTSDTLDSGAASPIAVAMPTSALGQSDSDIAGQLTALTTAPSLDTNPQIIICFKGSANQYGRLTIGSSGNVQGQKLTTHIQISNGSPSGICPA